MSVVEHVPVPYTTADSQSTAGIAWWTRGPAEISTPHRVQPTGGTRASIMDPPQLSAVYTLPGIMAGR